MKECESLPGSAREGLFAKNRSQIWNYGVGVPVIIPPGVPVVIVPVSKEPIEAVPVSTEPLPEAPDPPDPEEEDPAPVPGVPVPATGVSVEAVLGLLRAACGLAQKDFTWSNTGPAVGRSLRLL